MDEMSWDDMSKASMLWPSVSRVREYRRKVYDAVCAIIAELPEGGRVTQKGKLLSVRSVAVAALFSPLLLTLAVLHA